MDLENENWLLKLKKWMYPRNPRRKRSCRLWERFEMEVEVGWSEGGAVNWKNNSEDSNGEWQR